MNIFDKLNKGIATLEDQEEALKHPETACLFARDVPGADIEKCQEVACKDPRYAYSFSSIQGADIEKCQAVVNKDILYTYWFASDVSGANIEKCQEVVCSDPGITYWFAHDVPGADIIKCVEVCKGTEYEDRMNQLLMEKALT